LSAPLYVKVPIPGTPLSDEPAIEGPARMKAKARMKLMVRMWLSPVSVPASPPFRWKSHSQRLFPDICAPSGKWFHRAGYCFVGHVGRNIGEKNPMISIG